MLQLQFFKVSSLFKFIDVTLTLYHTILFFSFLLPIPTTSHLTMFSPVSPSVLSHSFLFSPHPISVLSYPQSNINFDSPCVVSTMTVLWHLRQAPPGWVGLGPSVLVVVRCVMLDFHVNQRIWLIVLRVEVRVRRVLGIYKVAGE